MSLTLLRLLPKALWPRFVLLMLLATGPMLGALVLSAVADGRRVVDAARDQVVQLARLAAEQQDDTLQEAINLLRVLAKVPAVRDMRDGQCGDLLRDVVADHPRIDAVAVARPDGVVACGSRPGSQGLNAGDRPYFQEAMGTDAPRAVLSNLVVSRVSGQPTMFVAVPVGVGAAKSGVMIASLNLGWFAHLGSRLPQGGNRLVQVLDSRDGAVLARGPDGTAQIGATAPDHPVLRAFRASPAGGAVVAPDLDGTRRVFGFAPLPGRGGSIVVTVGLAEAEVRQAADHRLGVALAVALGATAFAVLIGWRAADRALLRPIRALSAAAHLVGSGDLSAQARMERGAARELRALGSTFTRMARRLHERDGRIAGMGRQLAASEAHHRLLADTATDMIARFDLSFRHTYVSPACQDVLGLPADGLAGRALSDLVLPEDRAEVESSLVLPLIGGRAAAQVTYRVLRPDGRTTWVESSGRKLADGSGYVLVSRDVSARKALEAQLEDANRQLRILVRQDGLTGLGNRRHFDDTLGTEYRRAMRVGSPLALIMVDVDRFKAFNDLYGHPAGDACLQAVAAALASALRRPADLAARYGGEEFAVLLPSTDEAGAVACAARIQDAVREASVAHAGSEFGVVTLSLGITVLQPGAGGNGPAALVESADAALYAAKRAGRNTSHLAVGAAA